MEGWVNSMCEEYSGLGRAIRSIVKDTIGVARTYIFNMFESKMDG